MSLIYSTTNENDLNSDQDDSHRIDSKNNSIAQFLVSVNCPLQHVSSVSLAEPYHVLEWARCQSHAKLSR